MRRIRNFVFHFKYELILTICMFSNLYSLQLPQTLYYAALVGMAYCIIKFKARRTARTLLVTALVGVIFLSSMMAKGVGFRTLFISFLLLVALAFSSLKFYRFKFRFMYVSLIAYAFTSVINFYAKLAGVNVYSGITLSTQGYLSEEFSGYTCHPMWLSAACGIGTIFFVYTIIVMYKRRKKRMAYLLTAAAFCSLWVTMQGGSRSASGIAILCSLFLVVTAFKSATQKKKILIPILIIGALTIPTMVTENDAFSRKQGGIALVDQQGETSRSRLWAARVTEFKSSPIWGVGFGVTGIGKAAQEGRSETGSGWLTALSQTGIIGFLLVCALVYRTKLPRKVLQADSTVALLQTVMLFLCLHTLYEAYMFQGGWYMCFVFWLLVGILDDYKKYGPVPELENFLFGKEKRI